MPNYMDRLVALVNVRNYVDGNVDMADTAEVLPGVHMKDLRDIVMPTDAEAK